MPLATAAPLLAQSRLHECMSTAVGGACNGMPTHANKCLGFKLSCQAPSVRRTAMRGGAARGRTEVVSTLQRPCQLTVAASSCLSCAACLQLARHLSRLLTTLFTWSFFRSTYVWPQPTNMMGAPEVYTMESAAPTCGQARCV